MYAWLWFTMASKSKRVGNCLNIAHGSGMVVSLGLSGEDRGVHLKERESRRNLLHEISKVSVLDHHAVKSRAAEQW